jgi:hypothetical protein
MNHDVLHLTFNKKRKPKTHFSLSHNRKKRNDKDLFVEELGPEVC